MAVNLQKSIPTRSSKKVCKRNGGIQIDAPDDDEEPFFRLS
jgi:hypothetical protein